MSLHAQFKTDTAKEQAGVEVVYGPNKDGSVPTFILSRAGKSNKAYGKMLEARTRPYRRQMDLGTMNNAVAEDIFLDVFVATVLKGWQNVQNEGGTDIPFSADAAKSLFKELPELYEDLQEKSKQASLFRDASVEEEAGN